MKTMTVKIVFFSQLPEWVDKDFVSNNGSGKEYANYLLIEDGEYRACYSDAMEPEDCKFSRDLNWVVTELRRAAERKGKL